MILPVVIIILLFLRLSSVALNFYHKKHVMNIDEARILECVRAPVFLFIAVLCDFLIYLISFLSRQIRVGEKTSVRFRACVWSAIGEKGRNVRNQRIGSSRDEQKDIKLKVVKTSSRFSIYFQLHFDFLLGVFGKCFLEFSINATPTTKWVNARVCKCGLLPPENPIKLFIAFRFVRFFLITIPHISIIFLFSNFLLCPLSVTVVSKRGIFYRFVNVRLRFFRVVKSKPLALSWLKLEDSIWSQKLPSYLVASAKHNNLKTLQMC